jgi:hypothetical protein
MTTGNRPSWRIAKEGRKRKERDGHHEKEGIKKPEDKSGEAVRWNFAIITAGMPGGRTTGRWTARGAVAPFRPSSVKRDTALSTRMLPVRKKRKSREEWPKGRSLDKKPLPSYVAVRSQRRFQR